MFRECLKYVHRYIHVILTNVEVKQIAVFSFQNVSISRSCHPGRLFVCQCEGKTSWPQPIGIFFFLCDILIKIPLVKAKVNSNGKDAARSLQEDKFGGDLLCEVS